MAGTVQDAGSTLKNTVAMVLATVEHVALVRQTDKNNYNQM